MFTPGALSYSLGNYHSTMLHTYACHTENGQWVHWISPTTRINNIFRLHLGNLGKELFMVVNCEEDKIGYKMRERRGVGR